MAIYRAKFCAAVILQPRELTKQFFEYLESEKSLKITVFMTNTEAIANYQKYVLGSDENDPRVSKMIFTCNQRILSSGTH